MDKVQRIDRSNIDSWFIKQPKSGEHISGISASSCTEESKGSPAVKKK
jgi:hypothetical protein